MTDHEKTWMFPGRVQLIMEGRTIEQCDRGTRFLRDHSRSQRIPITQWVMTEIDLGRPAYNMRYFDTGPMADRSRPPVDS